MRRFEYLFSALGLVVVWELAVRFFDISAYIFPSPSMVLKSLIHGFTNGVSQGGLGAKQALWIHLGHTLYATMFGFVVGSLVGIGLAVMVSEFRILDRMMTPILTAFQSMPKVAVAPLFVIWFGYGSLTKVALATTLVFFPVMINSISGLKHVDADRIMLARALNASRWQVLGYIRIPSALPFIFSGIQVGAVYALLGTTVGELIAGNLGLGTRIVQMQSTMDISGVFAVLVVLGILGAAFHQLLAWIEARVLFWVQRDNVAL